ncbi:hypothetical protein HanXRQr2_Chr05g0204571 [Helianthus annuus]|uniref:Secreted protein n=1 Tax=Helianthus annuus TaxID=4232 RepID=A0A9K3IZP5_HELAN|nr:hypothetical protein HanXRQr2_Chr05g0204571 [Helianthus annuus]KAJ0921911.1 hypothetical protein HanPSC8_Chr05g0197261 [Helianthus annuus]
MRCFIVLFLSCSVFTNHNMAPFSMKTRSVSWRGNPDSNCDCSHGGFGRHISDYNRSEPLICQLITRSMSVVLKRLVSKKG